MLLPSAPMWNLCWPSDARRRLPRCGPSSTKKFLPAWPNSTGSPPAACRKAVEHKSTAFVVIENEPHARSCAALVLSLNRNGEQWARLGGKEYSAGTLLREVSCSVALARGKPVGNASSANFQLASRWAIY